MTESPPHVYVPVLRVPWLFPQLPGVVRWVRSDDGDRRPICWVTGERIERDGNTGEHVAGVEPT